MHVVVIFLFLFRCCICFAAYFVCFSLWILLFFACCKDHCQYITVVLYAVLLRHASRRLTNKVGRRKRDVSLFASTNTHSWDTQTITQRTRRKLWDTIAFSHKCLLKKCLKPFLFSPVLRLFLSSYWYSCTNELTFWRRNFFLILAHPVYKMWIIQESNTL